MKQQKKLTRKSKDEKSPLKPKGRSKYALKKAGQKKGKYSSNSPIKLET